MQAHAAAGAKKQFSAAHPGLVHGTTPAPYPDLPAYQTDLQSMHTVILPGQTTTGCCRNIVSHDGTSVTNITVVTGCFSGSVQCCNHQGHSCQVSGVFHESNGHAMGYATYVAEIAGRAAIMYRG